MYNDYDAPSLSRRILPWGVAIGAAIVGIALTIRKIRG